MAQLAVKAKDGVRAGRAHERISRAWMAQCAAQTAAARGQRNATADLEARLAAADAARLDAQRECSGLRARVARVVELKASQEDSHQRTRAELAAAQTALQNARSDSEVVRQRAFYYAGIAVKLQWALEGRASACDVAQLWDAYRTLDAATDPLQWLMTSLAVEEQEGRETH